MRTATQMREGLWKDLPQAAINAVKRIKRDNLPTTGAPINFMVFFPKWLDDNVNAQLDELENRIKEMRTECI